MFKKIVIAGLICISFGSVAFAGNKDLDPGKVSPALVASK